MGRRDCESRRASGEVVDEVEGVAHVTAEPVEGVRRRCRRCGRSRGAPADRDDRSLRRTSVHGNPGAWDADAGKAVDLAVEVLFGGRHPGVTESHPAGVPELFRTPSGIPTMGIACGTAAGRQRPPPRPGGDAALSWKGVVLDPFVRRGDGGYLSSGVDNPPGGLDTTGSLAERFVLGLFVARSPAPNRASMDTVSGRGHEPTPKRSLLAHSEVLTWARFVRIVRFRRRVRHRDEAQRG